VVDEIPGKILVVGREVELAVRAQSSQYHFGFAGLGAALRLFYRCGKSVRGFRSWDDSLGSGEAYSCRKAPGLGLCDRLDQAEFVDVRYERRHAVVAQTAGMYRVGNEVVSERVHLEELGTAFSQSTR
jgi:hypothetical protein